MFKPFLNKFIFLIIIARSQTINEKIDSNANISIYYTSENLSNDQIFQMIADLIKTAKYHIRISLYNFNSQLILDALKEVLTKQGKLKITIIADNRNYTIKPCFAYSIEELQKFQNVTVYTEKNQNYDNNHNKMIIIDSHTLISGSTNFTITQTMENLIVEQKSDSRHSTKNIQYAIDYFSSLRSNSKTSYKPISNLYLSLPSRSNKQTICQEAIIEAIQKAQKSIKIQIPYFSLWSIIKALINKAKNKITIIIHINDLFNETQSSETKLTHIDKLDELLKNNAIIKLHNPFSPLLHTKLIIIDDQIVFTGSYNCTISSEKHNTETLYKFTRKTHKECVEKSLSFFESTANGFSAQEFQKERNKVNSVLDSAALFNKTQTIVIPKI